MANVGPRKANVAPWTMGSLKSNYREKIKP